MIHPHSQIRQHVHSPATVIPPQVQMLLRTAAWCLYGIFLFNLIVLFLPPRLLAPEWQLLLVNSLLSQAPYALLGTCCLVLGTCGLPGQDALLKGRLRLLARLASLGFVLIIPLQLSASWRLATLAEVPANRLISTLRSVRREIQTSRYATELNTALSKLPGSPRLPNRPGLSLTTFKQAANRRLSQDLELQLSQQRQRIANRRYTDAITTARTALLALLLALFFATAAHGAVPLPSREAIRALNPVNRIAQALEEWNRRRQVAESLRQSRNRPQEQGQRLRQLLARLEAIRMQRRSLARARQFERLRRQAEKEASQKAGRPR